MKQTLKRTAFVLTFSAACFLPMAVHAAGEMNEPVQSVQQTRTIKGHVVDENGEPMIGVTIFAGTNNAAGAISDIDGNFTIVAASGSQLRLSYAGYKTLTVAAKDGGTYQMEPDVQGLDDVVVIGFGAVKKRDLTGSVASVKSDAILQTPTSDLATAIQGRITGLDVNGSQMRIRGNRSINGSNEPLVIIDGVQGGKLSDLNPDDIESIDVLKDASSTAIYGSQGANGVIIVTTKKAEAGRFLVSYNGFVTGAFRREHPDYRSHENYYETRRIAAQNAGNWQSTSDDLVLFGNPETLAAYRAGVWTDYEDLLQKDITWSTNHSITLSGGNDKTTARFSIGYANDGSRWKESSGTDRYTLRANIDHNIRKWISGGVNFQLTHNRSDRSPYEDASTSDVQLGSPYGYYDATSGNYLIGTELVERPLDSSGYVNPLLNTQGDDRFAGLNTGTNVVANGYLDIHPIDGLSFRTQVNASISNSTSGSYTDAYSASQINSGTIPLSTASLSKPSGLYLEWNNILTYSFTMLPEDHHLTLTALTSWGKDTSDELTATSQGQTLASNLWWNLASNDGAAGHMTHTSKYVQSQFFSYAGRLSYDYKSRYLFTASVRRDGASRLAEGHKWATFPSAALAWRISDEAFMQPTKSWLDDLKLRATYGVTGNSGIPPYGTISGVTFKNTALGFQDAGVSHYELGVKPEGSDYSIIGNLDTKWEKSTTIDFGFDLVMLNNRIAVTFDWYNTKTTDLILARTLPTSSGNDGKFQTYTNIGSTRNKGWELTVNSRNIQTKDFQWNSTLTLSANKEKILELTGGETFIQVGNKPEEGLMVGYPINSFRAFEYLGIWKTSEAAEAAQMFTDAKKTIPFKPGDIKVRDISGPDGEPDGWIDQSTDYTYLGSTSPKWFAGFNNDFRYKNFDLNIYLYARWGHWGDNPLAGYSPTTGGSYVTYDYWVPGTNEGGSFPALMQNFNFYDYKGYTAYWYCDRSFIKLKRVALGYTLPRATVKTLGIEKLRVYAAINNPFYVVKEKWVKHFDPESQQRSFTIGLNVNF